MKTLKKIFSKFIMMPNIPFMLVLAIYILYRVYQKTGLTEMVFLQGEDILTDDVKGFIDRVYPKWFTYVVAFVFYTWVFFKLQNLK